MDDKDDPCACTEYVVDMYKHFKELEVRGLHESWRGSFPGFYRPQFYFTLSVFKHVLGVVRQKIKFTQLMIFDFLGF